MATLIAFYNLHGCVGQCDAKCYNATTPQCTCVCGGANHGAGLEAAQQWTKENVADLLHSAKEFHTPTGVTFPDGADQLHLF